MQLVGFHAEKNPIIFSTFPGILSVLPELCFCFSSVDTDNTL